MFELIIQYQLQDYHVHELNLSLSNHSPSPVNRKPSH